MTGTEPNAASTILHALLESRPPGRALDLATGLGRNAAALAERGWAVDAVDLSRSTLDRARERVDPDPGAVEWILADVDSYAFPRGAYDLVAISFFDVRDRLPAVKSTLAPGGILFYEHYLETPPGESGPGDRFRFGPNELLSACADLRVLYYVERRVGGEPRVTLVARTDDGADRRRLPELPARRQRREGLPERDGEHNDSAIECRRR